MSNWTVNTTDLFEEWLLDQDAAMIEDIASSVLVLEEFGPMLGRTDVDTVNDSSFPNMKELRVQSNGRPVRAFFAFDPEREAIILCAGDKTGVNEKRFYKAMIKTADSQYRLHLEGLKDE